MRIATLVFIFLLSNYSWANDTTKVLFIGNSFTSQNNLPLLFKNLSESGGHPVVVQSHMPGGVSVGDISQGTSAHMNNPIVYDLINSNNWDYVVLQDNQGRFALGYGQFPSSSLVIEGHIKIRDSVKSQNQCAHMIWYAGFGTKDGLLPYAASGADMIDSIYQNYTFLLDTAGEIMAPIGPSFKKIIQNFPSINLWSSDDVHPSLEGLFLTACVVYSTIFKNHPKLSSYNPGLSAFSDSLLKETAYQTTIERIHETGLQDFTPEIVVAGNQISVSGSLNCDWYFNSQFSENNN